MIIMKKFKVVRCNKCGFIQVCGSKVLRCKQCNKMSQIVTKKGLNVTVYKSFDNGIEANKFITQLKNKELKKKKNIGFKEYQ